MEYFSYSTYFRSIYVFTQSDSSQSQRTFSKALIQSTIGFGKIKASTQLELSIKITSKIGKPAIRDKISSSRYNMGVYFQNWNISFILSNL